MTEGTLKLPETLKTALSLHQAGRLDEANDLYAKVLAVDPNNANALFLCGTIASQSGRNSDAVELLPRARDQAPAEAQIYMNLAVPLRVLGRLAEAETACRRAIELNPKLGGAHNNLGQILQDAGQPLLALDAYREAVKHQPDNPEFYNNLGTALASEGADEDAMVAYQQALSLRPKYAEALNNLGTLLIEQRNLDQAAEILNQALELKPNYPDALINLGNAYNYLNRPEKASKQFSAVLKMESNQPKAQIGLAYAFEFMGRIDDAIEAYRQAIAIKPDFGGAYKQLASLETPENVQKLVPAMEKLLSEPSLEEEQEAALCFALGRAYELDAKYDQAFQYFTRGGKLKGAPFNYDVAEDEVLMKRTANVFNDDFFSNRKGYGDPSDVPVFIVGMPRSGTSMIEQILASHTQVFGAGELINLMQTAHLIDRPPSPVFPETTPTLDPDEFRSLGEAYLNALSQRGAGNDRIIDKLPENFLMIGFIRLILPNAKIIHCVRNPLDTCVSCHNIMFGSGQRYSYDLSDLGRYYGAYSQLMNHFHKVLPGWILDVQYQDVIDNLEGETRRLLSFLDLPWDEACLSFHKTERAIQTASAGQVRRPLYKSSIARWKRYERHLGPLIEALGPLADENGY